MATLYCPACGHDDGFWCKHPAHPGAKRRWECRRCRSRTVAPSKTAVVARTPVSRELPQAERYVVTCAQNATPVHTAFLKTLEVYCKHNRAQLVVIPVRYKNPTSSWTLSQKNEEVWDDVLVPYLYQGRTNLNANLVLLADVKTQPTAARPLLGFESITGHRSAILGHPKMALETIATPAHKLPKIVTSTGAVTKRNYTDTKTGKKGDFHHTFGAVVVEIESDSVFHMRQLNAQDNGHFIDLDKKYSPDGVSDAGPALGLVMGDTHVLFADPAVVEATFGDDGIVSTLRPKRLVWHDVLDFYSANHHHKGNPFVALAKHRAGLNQVRREVELTCAFIAKHTPKDCQNVVVASNHNEGLERWIREHDWKGDPDNAEFYLETALEMARSTVMGQSASQTIDPFHYWCEKLLPPDVLENTVLLGRDEPFVIKDVECGYHGDKGSGGKPGNRAAYRRIGAKTVIGHSHAPGIDEGCYQTGTSSFMKLEYNTGLSAWLQTHCVIYANGKRSLINIVNGKYRT